MTEQLALYAWIDNTRGRARRTDPQTSHDAARLVNAASSEGRILDALRFGPLTDEELAECLAPSYPPTIKTARSRLFKAGLVESCGIKVNSRNREMLIWRLAGE